MISKKARRTIRRKAGYFRHEQRLHFISILFKLRNPRRFFGKNRKFLIGPTNSANQASAWSKALSLTGRSAKSLRISTDPVAEWFSTDFSFGSDEWRKSQIRRKFEEFVAKEVDIILFESCRPIFRPRDTKDENNLTLQDFDFSKRIGKKCGIIFHGSDIRDVDAHSARIEFSPFLTERPELEAVRSRSAENRALLPEIRSRKIPIFVSTKDLLLEVPDAKWLPIAIDFPRFASVSKSAPLYTSSKLRVLYLPSRSWLKSAEIIEPILQKLATEGVIEYINPGTVKHNEVPDLLAKADLVIDQFLGVVGVFPIEALASGRLVMSHIPNNSSDAPIINITPSTLESEIRKVVEHRPNPTDGVEYAETWHDGRASVKVITEAF